MKKNIEELQGFIDKIKDSNVLVIVEGKKDKTALQKLGINNVMELSRKALFQIVEEVASSNKECVILTDLDKKGKEIYGKTRFPAGASFTASPWACNGKLFFLSEEGKTYVVSAGEDFKLLHDNNLDELCLASPAISQGNLLLRTASKLYCITKP